MAITYTTAGTAATSITAATGANCATASTGCTIYVYKASTVDTLYFFSDYATPAALTTGSTGDTSAAAASSSQKYYDFGSTNALYTHLVTGMAVVYTTAG